MKNHSADQRWLLVPVFHRKSCGQVLKNDRFVQGILQKEESSSNLIGYIVLELYGVNKLNLRKTHPLPLGEGRVRGSRFDVNTILRPSPGRPLPEGERRTGAHVTTV